ncbi:S-layer homology domain-containing protein [Patescibacteria group bacterium]|nr:S-layer homology domain-containing protein [Patescibacteria group bacterium]MBU1683206.1 S-layer homology domain-containing protein [Patescibacteria group bacterium]MBU1935643.1 S-layer homology domain-containing protein [Patescibacteria group bacterium]
MLKKLPLAFAFALLSAFSFAFAAESDFGEMNPTVKITSYKELFSGHIIAYGSGSGTVISSKGLVVTNNHVIYDDVEQKPFDTFEICITFDVQEEPVCKYTARLVANDEDMDIAILKINTKDVFNQSIGSLDYLNYQTNAEPIEESEVQVIGYPGSGGETITITRGQISGYDTYNDYKYFKTDTDFDHGSSGGTALDEDGNFIGIPTYIRTYAENVGYFLDLREAVDWINDSKTGSPINNENAEGGLIMEMARLSSANEDLKLSYYEYPGLSIEVPEGWKFLEINDDNFYTEQNQITDGVGIGVYLNYYQYPIDEGYLEALDEELAEIQESYPDYKKEEIEFAGQNAIQITYSLFNHRQYTIYIPYGYTLIGLNYVINLDKEEKQLKAMEEVLDSVELTIKETNDPDLDQTISFDDPPFSVTMPNGWRIQKNKSNQPMDLLADAVQEGNFDGYIYIYYQQIPKGEQELDTKDRIDEDTDYLGYNSKVIYKKDDVVIDGLTGYLYTYEYEGDKYQEMHKRLTVKLQNGEYEFVIYYDDLSKNFDENIADIEEILTSFEFEIEDLEQKGVYDYGSFISQFTDIQNHRFANAISELADIGVLQGYDDGSFKPENLVSRAETLKIILTSKNYLDEEKGLGKEIDFSEYKKDTPSFWDIKKDDWFNEYVHYGYENEIIEGYYNNSFRPHSTVNLAEALKMIIGVYEITLWDGETNPWYKIYMDKGYELGLIPRGLEDPGHTLTRAELAHIINSVYNQAK